MKIVLLSLLSLLAFARISPACAVTETGTPVCAFYTRADVVFSGKAVSVESASKSEELPEGARKVRFQVLQNFKGADNPTITVVLKETKSDGGLNVKSGQTWIVYAASDIVVKSFSVFRGVRIEPKTASDEAEILKSVAAGKTETAVSGKFDFGAASGDLAGEAIEIAVSGNGKTFAAKTDAQGAFDVPLPAGGSYKIEIKIPFRANLKWNEATLGASLAEGVPTVFRYEVRLGDGDCHFSFFEVSQKSP